jgi:hypothetical protein
MCILKVFNILYILLRFMLIYYRYECSVSVLGKTRDILILWSREDLTEDVEIGCLLPSSLSFPSNPHTFSVVF